MYKLKQGTAILGKMKISKPHYSSNTCTCIICNFFWRDERDFILENIYKKNIMHNLVFVVVDCSQPSIFLFDR